MRNNNRLLPDSGITRINGVKSISHIFKSSIKRGSVCCDANLEIIHVIRKKVTHMVYVAFYISSINEKHITLNVIYKHHGD